MTPSWFIRSLLTYGTKERGAAVLGDAPHDAGAAAGRTAAALAVVDAEFVLKVAEPGHDLLVEQCGFQTRRLPGAGPREACRREGAVERLGADPHQRMFFELGAGHEQHESEPARVVERYRRAGRHAE